MPIDRTVARRIREWLQANHGGGTFAEIARACGLSTTQVSAVLYRMRSESAGPTVYSYRRTADAKNNTYALYEPPDGSAPAHSRGVPPKRNARRRPSGRFIEPHEMH